jgi:hypothetical protein
MQNDQNENSDLKSLLEKKEQLLKEKENILKERSEILREQNLPKREENSQSEAKDLGKSAEIKSSIPDLFGQSTKLPSNAQPGRRGLLRNLLLGVTLTFSSVALLLLLSAPSIERAAYIQLSLLLEQGSIFFINKLQKVRFRFAIR